MSSELKIEPLEGKSNSKLVQGLTVKPATSKREISIVKYEAFVSIAFVQEYLHFFQSRPQQGPVLELGTSRSSILIFTASQSKRSPLKSLFRRNS